MLCPRAHHTYRTKRHRFADFSGSSGADGSRGTCETGFLPLDPSQLRSKQSVEFGLPASKNRPMPRVDGLRVSVVYDAIEIGDSWMLNATLPTVIENFPGAMEVVVVAGDEAAGAVFGEVLDGYRNFAPFDLRVVVATDKAFGGGFGGDSRDGAARLRFPLIWADKYCSGSFVLHLNTDDVLLKKVTYDHIFHFGKPVIPFTRFTDNGEEGRGGRGDGSRIDDVSSTNVLFVLWDDTYTSHSCVGENLAVII